MNNADAILGNRSLLPRTINLKRRILLASAAAKNIWSRLPPEELEGDMAELLGYRFRELAKKVRTVERILYRVDDRNVSSSDGQRLRKLMLQSSRSISYLLPTAKRIYKYLEKGGGRFTGEELERCSAKLRLEVIQAHEIMSSLKRDIEVLADRVEEEFPEEEKASRDGLEEGPTTRLSLAELAGVLGVDESALTDAVRGGEKIEGLQVDRWVRGKADHQPHFQVPNQILRDRGAEALIVDNPLGEDLD